MSRIQQVINQHHKLWLALSAALLFIPWVLPVNNACQGRGSTDYPWCALDRGPIVSLLVIIGVLLALGYCKAKRIQRMDIHTLLQIAGIIALIGFGEVIPFLAGALYGLSLIALAGHGKKGSKDLSTSPLYATIFLTVLFLAGAAMGQEIGVVGGPALFAAYATFVVGMLWLNIWTKKHSIALYVFLIPCFMIVSLGAIVYYSAWSYVHGWGGR